MGYRHIYIKSAKHLSHKHSSLIILKAADTIEVPLEDIATILLEDQTTTITASLLAELANQYILLITCDKRFLPCSMSIPMHMHYRELKVFNMQLEVKKPIISQLWAMIVASKLGNQIAALSIHNCDVERIQAMKEVCKDIKSGDKTNREAVGAKIFFTALYGNTFTRNHNASDGINMALNYGYSIMAANMTRILTMYGFHTMLGLHHESKTNSFNLSYDFVEPFRAVVDIFVYKNRDNIYNPLSKEMRIGLIDLLQESILLNGKHYSIQNAMEEVVLSFIQCLDKENSSLLLLPTIEYNETADDHKLQANESSSFI